LALPATRCLAGGAQHPVPDAIDQAGLLGNGDESLWADDAKLGVTPTEQRLDADDAAGCDVHLGLVYELQLIALDGLAQRGLKRKALHIEVAGLALVHGECASSPRLCPIERNGGIAKQGVDIAVGRMRLRDPDADSHEYLVTVDDDRLGEAVQESLGQFARRSGLRFALAQHDHEFVAVEARKPVLIGDA
jgi:hypothetical protein